MKRFLLLLLIPLAACVPTARYTSPDSPIVYPVAYRALFDATLQELTAAYVPDALDRRTFSITQADLDTGLITAVRNQPGTTATLRYRYEFDDEDDGDFGPWPFFGLNFAVPVPNRQPEQTIITLVIRPEGAGASIIYSSQSPSGSASYDADRLMRQVIARLDARFLTPVSAEPSPAVPMEPENP
jgi:hypothetical protein